MDKNFVVKDSGARQVFGSGMVRDTTAGKVDYTRVLSGPMLRRWAEHLSKGAVKYPDIRPGAANWTLAAGETELSRFKESALRHLIQWMCGETDEDHAAAVFFNINGAEYVKAREKANLQAVEPKITYTTNERAGCNLPMKPCQEAVEMGWPYLATCSACVAANA